MIRQNDVRFYGFVADKPKITMTNGTNELVRGMMHLAVIRSERFNGENNVGADRIMYDYPIILTTDPEMIAKMQKLELYDIVEIKGSLVTRKITKHTYCSGECGCGARNDVEGNISFVMPLVMAKRNKEKGSYTKNQAEAEIIENREFSNSIVILGNLCQDVTYFHEKNIQTSTYQVATDRKYVVQADSPDVTADYPLVRSYGRQAKKDSMCIHTGSTILIDGYLHTRRPQRTTLCESCGVEYQWADSVMEIIPFVTEYLANYTDYQTAKAEEAKKAEEAFGT
ncbi:single-stranded DNA-binding protein [Butyrivibrio sp.]|uniref:single-stranded DNA-binding protein n=1 Tax=Butyrivibrio sp. TaxID=28121 RepID=UPI0025BC0AAA|nr:single-stranded DNA-binding protein [Butyrivibrio sp.]MBQ7430276.1 single-stranded DNA-binding protein [Butyrivibrio sp.]MBQ9303450.1 single-stranded DNA-binding protein [Butyrivibrio sp.]